MSDTTTEAVERIAAAPWCYASEDIAATLRALTAERASWISAQHYSYIGRDYKKVRASDLEDRAEAAEAAMSEQALQFLATSRQAADAYTAQMEAESAIPAAVLAERERCAVWLASNAVGYDTRGNYHIDAHDGQGKHAGMAYAAAIRKGHTS